MVNYQADRASICHRFWGECVWVYCIDAGEPILTKRFHLVNLLRTGAVIQLAAAGVLLILGLFLAVKQVFIGYLPVCLFVLQDLV